MRSNTHTKLTISITLPIPSALFTLLVLLFLSSVVERHVCAFGPAYNIASTSTTSGTSSSAIVTTAITSRISMMMTTKATNGIDSSNDDDGNLLNFRYATLEDVPRCFEIESASYPSDEAAPLASLTNRQIHAGMYFILCTTTNATEKQEQETIIGFVCGTRCTEFSEQSMSEHNPSGKLLAIHSIVVEERYRRKGIASKMTKQYIRNIIAREKENDTEQQQSISQPVESIVLIAKQHLLGFYVRCGFCVNRPSSIVHGRDLWYEIEMEIPTSIEKTEIIPRTLPRSDESWFCKTERFSRPFPEVKPYLEEHEKWVQSLRETQDVCIVSGYRVDDQGKPGGGGLMFLAAKSYEEAFELVSKYDPLIVNKCVDWELNGWIGQVGDISIQ